MPTRNILQHHCTRSDFDDGLPFANCHCRHNVSRREAEELVAAGFADWKKQRDVTGNISNNRSEIVRSRLHPQHARLITHGDVKRAYIEKNETEQQRIEIYGRLGVEVIEKLVKREERSP